MPRLSSATVAGRASRVLGLGALLWFGSVWAAEDVTIRENSPTQYTVVEGDTLWDIAGMFLEEPWLWPEVWQINPQIENPDLIYPGDVIELAYVDGNPVLRLSRGDAPPGVRTVRLSPQVRREPLLSAIPAIALDEISAHLISDTILSEAEFENAPRVLGDNEGRTIMSTGDEILAHGNLAEGVALYDIVREGRELEDPDTGDLLGIEGILVGTATLNRSDFDSASLTITSNKEEIRPGDHLIPSVPSTLDASLLPVPPAFSVNAAIVGIENDRHIAGRYDTIILNVGASDRIVVGQLLAVQEPNTVLDDPYQKRSLLQKLGDRLRIGEGTDVTFSGERIATVLVYRVFDESSFGLVLESERDVRLNDRVVRPD
jgi:hypothetical protein